MDGQECIGFADGESVFQRCMDARSGVICSLVCKFGSRDIVEDAVQEALIRAYKRLCLGEAIDHSFHFLLVVARRIVIDALRYNDRHPTALLGCCDHQSVVDEQEATPLDPALTLFDGDSIASGWRWAIEVLPVAERWIVEQHGFGEKSFSECAAQIEFKASGPTLCRLFEESIELARYVHDLRSLGHMDLVEVELELAAKAEHRGRTEIRKAHQVGLVKLGHWKINSPAA